MLALFDLSPLANILLVGVVLALGPLLWVWFRNRNATSVRRIQALTLVTLFLTFDLVLFGAFTRLTDSGLGCPDWPGCYGNATPVGASVAITAAQTALPGGPVTHQKAWVEMIHRYLASGVGLLILVLSGASWWVRAREPKGARVSPWWPTLTLVWVCVQGAFGALTVTMKLFPAIVTLHLLGGLVLLSLLCVQVVRAAQFDSGNSPAIIQPALRRLAVVAFILLFIQVALGGWVSTNYAVLVCNEFPMCQSSWWPLMNFSQGFQVWRELGFTGAGEHISFAALTAIHFVHRVFAFVVLIVLGLLAWRLNLTAELRIPSRWISALIGLQLATGLSNVVLGWPLLGAVLHTGGAAALVIVLTWVLVASQTLIPTRTSIVMPSSKKRFSA